MSPRPHITVVGDVGLDVMAKLAGSVVFGQDTRAAVAVAPGGAGGNTAAWLARQDVDVSLIARVGADEAGRSAERELTAAGVNCCFAVDPRLPTCCVVVLVAPDGDRTMLADRGANAAFSPDDVVLPQIAGPGHLHLSGYVLLDTGSRAAGLAALAAAREAGWTISVDPQAANHIPSVGARTFLSWVEQIDLLLPNDAELAALGGVEAVLDVVKSVVVTHGRHGASWYSRSVRLTTPAPQVHEADSTGAGDAFNAGLLAAWLAGADPLIALQAGVLAGSEAASRVGARPRVLSPDAFAADNRVTHEPPAGNPAADNPATHEPPAGNPAAGNAAGGSPSRPARPLIPRQPTAAGINFSDGDESAPFGTGGTEVDDFIPAAQVDPRDR